MRFLESFKTLKCENGSLGWELYFGEIPYKDTDVQWALNRLKREEEKDYIIESWWVAKSNATTTEFVTLRISSVLDKDVSREEAKRIGEKFLLFLDF